MNTQKEQNQSHAFWPALCALITIAGASLFSSTVWGRTQKPQTLLLTLALAVVGYLLGLTFRKTRVKRIISVIASLLVFVLCLILSRYFTSDHYICKKEWKEYSVGNTHFMYPSLEWKKISEGIELANGRVSMYTNENMNRYVCAFVYDFTVNYPELSDTTEGAIKAMLQNFKASFVSWDKIEPDQSSLKMRFIYTRAGKSFTGIASAQENEGHYEILMFFPLKKQYSEEFMQKIEEGILPKSAK